MTTILMERYETIESSGGVTDSELQKRKKNENPFSF